MCRLLFFIFFVCIHSTLCQNEQMHLILTSIDQCSGRNDLPIRINHWQIVQKQKNNFYLTGTINFTQDFPNGFEIQVRIDKCQADARLGNCDTFTNSFDTKNVCYLAQMTQTHVLKFFFDAVQPKIDCPLHAGIYSVEELKADDSLNSYLPQMGATFWNIIAVGQLEDEDVACVEISAQVRPRRRRRRPTYVPPE